MSIYQVTDISSSEINSTQYDVAVFASGYENRCIFVPNLINKENTRKVITLGFKDLANTEPRTDHDRFFKEKYYTDPIITKSSDDFTIQSLLNAESKNRKIKRILVDCSSMSRLWYSAVLNWAQHGNTETETVIDFIYAFGKYSSKDTPMIIEDMVTMPGCEGTALRSRQSLAIFGLGFNGWASLSVLERLEADHVYAFIASPGSSPEYVNKVHVMNKDFLEEPRVKPHIIKLPLNSVEIAYRYLSELVTPYRKKESITLVPMGPKPHVLASILVAMRFPEVSCMRVSARRQNPEKVEASGDMTAVRVIARNDNILPTLP